MLAEPPFHGLWCGCHLSSFGSILHHAQAQTLPKTEEASVQIEMHLTLHTL